MPVFGSQFWPSREGARSAAHNATFTIGKLPPGSCSSRGLKTCRRRVPLPARTRLTGGRPDRAQTRGEQTRPGTSTRPRARRPAGARAGPLRSPSLGVEAPVLEAAQRRRAVVDVEQDRVVPPGGLRDRIDDVAVEDGQARVRERRAGEATEDPRFQRTTAATHSTTTTSASRREGAERGAGGEAHAEAPD